jgi:hypothetical protein
VSLRDSQGRNIFAVSDAELQAGGRSDASYSDTKFLSQEGEWFLAGILEGIADGALAFLSSPSSLITYLLLIITVMPMVSTHVVIPHKH